MLRVGIITLGLAQPIDGDLAAAFTLDAAAAGEGPE